MRLAGSSPVRKVREERKKIEWFAKGQGAHRISAASWANCAGVAGGREKRCKKQIDQEGADRVKAVNRRVTNA